MPTDLGADLATDLGTDLGTVTQTATADDAELRDTVTLDYASRFLRRKRLTTDGGGTLLVNLAETTNLTSDLVLVLPEGGAIGVRAAPEALLRVTGPDLTRLAWHIGNRHTPCQITPEALYIQHDHVLADMLRGLGGAVSAVEAPFEPEGGAYGHGRTMGHAHGPEDHHHHHDHHAHE